MIFFIKELYTNKDIIWIPISQSKLTSKLIKWVYSVCMNATILDLNDFKWYTVYKLIIPIIFQ